MKALLLHIVAADHASVVYAGLQELYVCKLGSYQYVCAVGSGTSGKCPGDQPELSQKDNATGSLYACQTSKLLG